MNMERVEFLSCSGGRVAVVGWSGWQPWWCGGCGVARGMACGGEGVCVQEAGCAEAAGDSGLCLLRAARAPVFAHHHHHRPKTAAHPARRHAAAPPHTHTHTHTHTAPPAEEINKRPDEYWSLVMDIARRNNLKRVLRCTQIMGRSENDDLSAAQIFYPIMQAADIFFLKVWCVCVCVRACVGDFGEGARECLVVQMADGGARKGRPRTGGAARCRKPPPQRRGHATGKTGCQPGLLAALPPPPPPPPPPFFLLSRPTSASWAWTSARSTCSPASTATTAAPSASSPSC